MYQFVSDFSISKYHLSTLYLLSITCMSSIYLLIYHYHFHFAISRIDQYIYIIELRQFDYLVNYINTHIYFRFC